MAAAKARGVRFGRPPVPLPLNFYEIRQMIFGQSVNYRAD